ncbi:hypothetical protein FRC05_004999 [Tulasnella sp. 425]|nr:hypothetical protein FRC05_004999 [Tulasnella sp. 425]
MADNAVRLISRLVDGQLLLDELPWAARFDFLQSQGYLLRPRYRPGWVATWKTDKAVKIYECEDGIAVARPNLLDATRISDKRTAFLKHISKSSPEIEIERYLSTKELQSDPRNHALPALDVLEDPSDSEHVLLVLPLVRRIDTPEPASVRESVDMVEQTLEGLGFLHEYKVAHRDCAWGNIMMDGRDLFPNGWHPQGRSFATDGTVLKNHRPSRAAVGGVRYYFIAFGISTHNQDLTVGSDGQEPAPELSDNVPYDPYKLDVYILGMVYRRFLLERQWGNDWVLPLVQYMTPSNPEERPTAAEALKRFKLIKQELSQSVLGQRLHSLDTRPGVSSTIKDAQYRVSDFFWTLKPKRKPGPPF